MQADGVIERYAMSFDLEKILADKRRFRRSLAALPIAEKLGMLDALRERELAIRGRRGVAAATTGLREEPPPYRTGTK